MTRSMIIPLLFGLIGAAVLISLGMWQVQRLAWKEAILAEIAATVDGPPVAIAIAMQDEGRKYTPVNATGTTLGPEVHVLVSRKQIGAGYRVITGLDLNDGTRVLLDRGFIRAVNKDDQRPPVALTLAGNLHVPDDRTSSTPANDEAGNIWFARDIADLARVLDTQPILIVARSDTGQGVEAMPLGVEGIANDHLQYAITWFSLAIVWLGMTAFLLWRIKLRTD